MLCMFGTWIGCIEFSSQQQVGIDLLLYIYSIVISEYDNSKLMLLQDQFVLKCRNEVRKSVCLA